VSPLFAPWRQIEKRDAMVIKPAGVRAICTEDYMQPSLVPIEKICPKVITPDDFLVAYKFHSVRMRVWEACMT
jgi:hypothetical protein